MSIDLGEGGERWGGKGDAYRTPSHFSNSILLGLGNQLLCKLWLAGFLFQRVSVLRRWYLPTNCLGNTNTGCGRQTIWSHMFSFLSCGWEEFQSCWKAVKQTVGSPTSTRHPPLCSWGSYGCPPSSKKYGSLNCKLKLQILGTLLLWVWANILFPRSDIFM